MILVKHSSAMSPDDLRKHLDLRHSRVRFQTRGEHEADHRLHPSKDHEHSEGK